MSRTPIPDSLALALSAHLAEWALHDALVPRYRAGLLLAAFAGLRLAEVCGLRVTDVDFMRGIVSPAVHYGRSAETEISRSSVPIPADLALMLSRHVEDFSTHWIMCDELAGRWAVAAAAGLQSRQEGGPGPTGRVPVPRPSALLPC
jgi:hypothetical protein